MLWSYKKCQKIGIGKGLGCVKAKNVLVQTIPDKIFGTKWNNPVKPNGRRKRLVSAFVFFSCYWQSLSS